MRMLDEARWGRLILETPWGKYFWSQTLCDVTYFEGPKGLRASQPTNRHILMVRQNTLEHAIRRAAIMATDNARQCILDAQYARVLGEIQG